MKAKVKKVEDKISDLPVGMKVIDLSTEKRIELYQKALSEFDSEATKMYGVSISVELSYTKAGIKPIMVLVDMLKVQQNESKLKETNKKE